MLMGVLTKVGLVKVIKARVLAVVLVRFIIKVARQARVVPIVVVPVPLALVITAKCLP